MPNMIKFFRRKINPFKKCTNIASYSFETSPADKKQSTNKYEHRLEEHDTEIARSNCALTSKIDKKKNRFPFKFKKVKKSSISSNSTSNSLNNVEVSISLIKNMTNSELREEDHVAETFVVCNTPASSLSSNLENSSFIYSSNDEIAWTSQSHMQSYSNEKCIDDIIQNTNLNQKCFSPANNSMVTYNTKYANNSQLNDDDEDGFKTSINLQQSTPFDEVNSPQLYNKKRTSNIFKEVGFSKFKKSKTTHFRFIQSEIEVSSSPIFNKMDFKQNRKCRRSNTTFTIAGTRKNKIIDYFNKLEITKPIKKERLFCSNKELSNFRMSEILDNKDPEGSKGSDNTNKSDYLEQSKNEIEKIQDLFFYDDSYNLSNSNKEEDLSDDKNVPSTFMDSPISVEAEKIERIETTPVYKCTNQSKLMTLNDMTSTNNSLEKFRRSSSMPGLNEPNLSIQANNSKINTLKTYDEELNMNITPKKALNFEQNDLINNSIENLSLVPGQFISSFEVCDDEPKPFVRGQPRNLSKNIKQMFKNVIKLQLDALNQLEKFYEAQLVKLETDRRQNLELNPRNKDKINQFFDQQLELLEERVQLNLQNISKDKQPKLSTTSTLKLADNASSSEDNDDSIQRVPKNFQKQLFSQKLAQIITSNQTCNAMGRRSQSKNFMELKNNLINQNNLLPSKILSVQANDYSPKEAIFKRNLSLPFKQCKQNYRFVRNESVHGLAHLNKSSPQISPLVQHKKPTPVERETESDDKKCQKNNSNEDCSQIKKAHEISQRCLVANSLAKIVKLNRADVQQNFVVSTNSAFKPIRREFSTNSLFQNDLDDAEADQSQIFKPISLDVRRNSSIFYTNEMARDANVYSKMPLPRLSDSHLLFKIKQEKRLNERTKCTSNYQKQYQSKTCQNILRQNSKNNFHIETEV